MSYLYNSLGLILGLVCSFASKTEPYRAYCSVSSPFAIRLLYYFWLMATCFTSLVLILPVMYNILGGYFKAKSKEQSNKSKKGKSKLRISKRQMQFIKRMSWFVLAYSGAVGIASIPRVRESFQFKDYPSLLKGIILYYIISNIHIHILS